MPRQIIFDMEIFLENGKYKHHYTLNTPDKNDLSHLLFICFLLEKSSDEIKETDIAKLESEWKND